MVAGLLHKRLDLELYDVIGPGEGLRSDVTAAPYVFTRCATVSDVRFRSESPRLTSKAKARIGKVAAKMRAKGFKHVCLVGHTDNRGPTSYNKRLSELRVKAVGQRLEKQMPRARVSDGAKGETKPMRANDTSGGRATNRRVSVGIG